MKFVDEVKIEVKGGNGGNGCLSFRREKFVPNGGPNGGNGGHGGSVYLIGDAGRNTLLDLRYQRHFRAKSGEGGQGWDCTGAKGDDCEIRVPLGTVIFDAETEELIGEITDDGVQLCVAEGGRGGLGNAHFKSSRNRAPRKTTPGQPGEQRLLRLELKVMADVGLVGFPNAGKSSLIRAISAATPKVADYPFTTMHPQLGVVRIDHETSFVVADLPGLIEGAAEGAGLGIRFLKHIARTVVLLHVVDIATDPVETILSDITQIESEFSQFDASLLEKKRFLVFNKTDLLTSEDAAEKVAEIVKGLKHPLPYFCISAKNAIGTQEMCYTVSDLVVSMRPSPSDGSDDSAASEDSIVLPSEN